MDEARKAGLRVAAHAHGDEGALAAVKAGVHSIEHGTFISDQTLASMQQRGTYYVPTFAVTSDCRRGRKIETTRFWRSAGAKVGRFATGSRRSLRSWAFRWLQEPTWFTKRQNCQWQTRRSLYRRQGCRQSECCKS